MRLNKKIINIIHLFLIFTVKTNAEVTKSATCFNRDLEKIGCSCNSPIYYTKTCTNGIVGLECSFKNDTSINYMSEVVSSLNEMTDYCWFKLYFKNVLELDTYSFARLAFASQGNDNFIYLKFKNILRINEYALESIDSVNNDDIKLIIEIDSPHTEMSKYSLSKIRAEQFTFKNIRNLILFTSLFESSTIKTIQIEYSNVTKFIRDSKFEEIDNLIIDNCVVDELFKTESISGFQTIDNIQIKNSGLTFLKPKLFSNCCKYLKQLQLNNNRINIIDQFTFKGLFGLQYLNLANNPLQSIETNAFSSFTHSLKKINLKSTKLDSMKNILKNMTTLKEVILSDTKSLQLKDLRTILTDSKRIEYLDLENSNILLNSNQINYFLNELDSILNSTETTLFYLNARANDFNLNDFIFNKTFADSGTCLWLNLQYTFIRVNEDQECYCSLFYLYKNITNFNFPIKMGAFNSFKNLRNGQLNNITLWEIEILPLMPKCYRNLWLETFNLDKIYQKEAECGFNNIIEDCNNITHSTTSSPNTIIPPTSPINQKYIIHSNYTMPVILSIFIFAIITILILIIKAKLDYKNRFLKLFQNNFENLTIEPKELNNLSSRFSFNVFSFDPRNLSQQ